MLDSLPLWPSLKKQLKEIETTGNTQRQRLAVQKKQQQKQQKKEKKQQQKQSLQASKQSNSTIKKIIPVFFNYQQHKHLKYVLVKKKKKQNRKDFKIF